MPGFEPLSCQCKLFALFIFSFCLPFICAIGREESSAYLPIIYYRSTSGGSTATLAPAVFSEPASATWPHSRDISLCAATNKQCVDCPSRRSMRIAPH
ncbi:hypothetical protein BGZ61DRAFT_4287 [Ilyonectria robusta]|uniref:uncharacterized protein n=1 Tax=Ilyonectria robusta TaxID=1079257 RepID=UPI001E8EE159|nr:uncharacterized protein BGZ61DRAFT_4287 [Ilyonectria robusta]KAH8736852.1 hypothetical protein BGZ61DRAFT_4287 [Ilyonectria robusta]